MEIAPAVTNVTENPPQLAEQDPLTINATVKQRAGVVNAVKLTYRIGFGSEQTLLMSETGVGIYSATIPASAYSAGDMVRWQRGRLSVLSPFAFLPPDGEDARAWLDLLPAGHRGWSRLG